MDVIWSKELQVLCAVICGEPGCNLVTWRRQVPWVNSGSPHVRESGFQNPRSFARGIRNARRFARGFRNPRSFAPGFRNPRSLLVESGIRNPGTFARGFLNPRSFARGFRNPEKFCLWNPESWTLEFGISLTIGVRNPSPTSRDWNSVRGI